MSPVVISHWSWWMAALVLLATEAFFPGAIFLWLGIASGVVGLVSYVLPTIAWDTQLALFSIVSLFSIAGWRYFRRETADEPRGPLLNQRARQYVGRSFVLSEAIDNGVGKLRVDDTIWRAIGPDCPVGTVVEVVDVDGVNLKVKKIQS